LDENKKKKWLSTKNIILYVLSMLALVFCIYIVSSVIVANAQRRPPRIFGLSISYVPTESMEPVINSGDYVLFRQASYNEIKVNDIIVYYNEPQNKYIIHRVVAKYVDGVVESKIDGYDSMINLVETEEKNYLVTKGDNNGNVTDKIAVTNKLVYGKYLTVIGFMSIFSKGINQSFIYFILIAIFIVMIVMQTISIIIKKKADEAKKENENKELEKQKMLEELRQEILEEELAKLKIKAESNIENIQEDTKDTTEEEKIEDTEESNK